MNLFFKEQKNISYQIFATIDEESENIFEVATWTDTIHFESDKIKYKTFSNLEDAEKHVRKTFDKFLKN